MIGQERLLKTFTELIASDEFPRTCILTGSKGAGKKTLANEVAEMMKAHNHKMQVYKLPDVKIDTIRSMIDMSYKATSPTLYIIADADGMSIPAKNALLKITEEPPNKAYFLMTLENIDAMLDTIRSRSQVYALDNYTRDDIVAYIQRCHRDLKDDEQNVIVSICDIPGDVDAICSYKPLEFYNYVEKVVHSIARVEGCNAFKIASKLSLKADAEGYDVKLFLRAFMTICLERMRDEPLLYASGVSITSSFLAQLTIKSASKQMLIDDWILTIRKTWMGVLEHDNR